MEVTAAVSGDQMSFSCPSCKTPFFRSSAGAFTSEPAFPMTCSSCGTAFSVRDPASLVQTASPVVAVAPAEQSDAPRFCIRCGTKMTTAFCPSCGAAAAGGGGKQVASEIGKRIAASSLDAYAAVRRIALDPVGGLAPAYEALGETRAQAAGIALAAIFALASAFGSTAGAKHWFGGTIAYETGEGMKAFFKLVVVFLVLPIVMMLTTFAARKMLRAQPPLAADIFTTGAALTPMGVIILIGGVIGISNMEILGLLMLFAWIYLLLMMFAGMTRVGALPEQLAAPMLPVVLFVTGWLSKVIYGAMMS